MVAENVFFAIFAAVMVVAALRVVTSKNIVHAALWLATLLAAAAAQYILLAAEFVAVTQVLIYVGAVTVLFLFGVMLTRAKVGAEENLSYRRWGVGFVVALGLAGLLAYVLIDAFGDDELPDEPVVVSTAAVADSIFGTYLLPFWALSFLLLAAVIGAIVLARRD